MGLKLISTRNFYFNLFEKQIVPSNYKQLHYKNKELLQKTEVSSEHLNSKSGVSFITLFPTYFTPDYEIPQGYNLKKIFRVAGHCIIIENENNIDEYIKAHIKSNLRTILKRKLKGLETSFNVQYKLFFGQISRTEYEFLMDALHIMLTIRFDQRNDRNDILSNWDSLYANVFHLINEKKASLYVIYDDEIPIQIALSYHCDKILFLAVPTYDIDYAKFGLGNIAVQKILDWSIENNYEIMDMGFGAFDYKLKWCNHTYNFEHHLIYKEKSLLSYLIVQGIKFKVKFVNYLMAKEIHKKIKTFKTFFQPKPEMEELSYSFEPTDFKNFNVKGLLKIDVLNNPSFNYLKKPIYDFLYSYMEHKSSLEVYEIKNNDSYYLKGKKNNKIVNFIKHPIS